MQLEVQRVSDAQATTKGPQFKLSTVFAWMAFFALVIGWYTSTSRERSRNAMLGELLSNARLQVSLAESRGELQAEARSSDTAETKRVYSVARFDSMSLRGAVIQVGDSAFQRAIFDNSDLSNAALTGGAASFQGASFKNAKLRNAKLSGGAGAFQVATFEDADLASAVLIGNLQGVSLRNANCEGATISGLFQAANIDAAQFAAADLSAIRSEDLASCYYKDPPTYDAQTKFPADFDPIARGWKKTAAGSKND